MSDPNHMESYYLRRDMNEQQKTETQPACGWAKLFHPRGPQITLPVPADPKEAFAWVDDALGAGWLVQPAGCEAGEHKDLCGAVVRSQKEGMYGMSEVLDLYLPDDKYAKVRVYLNRPEEIEAFEYASKMQVSRLPIYIGDNKIEKGKNKQTDKLIVTCPAPFGFVWKDNPKYDAGEKDTKNMKPKRLFVRWEVQMPAKAENATPDAPQGQECLSDMDLKDWLDHIKTLRQEQQLNNAVNEIKKTPAGTQERLKRALLEQATLQGYEWSRQISMFVRRKAS